MHLRVERVEYVQITRLLEGFLLSAVLFLSNPLEL